MQPQKLRSKDNRLCHFQVKVGFLSESLIELNTKEDVILQTQCLGTALPQERGQRVGLFEVTRLLKEA